LGPIVGEVNFANPVRILDNVEAWKTLVRHAWDILPMSAILAVVATMDSLLAFRAAQNVSDLNISPVRDLFAQGVANIVSALAGGNQRSITVTNDGGLSRGRPELARAHYIGSDLISFGCSLSKISRADSVRGPVRYSSRGWDFTL